MQLYRFRRIGLGLAIVALVAALAPLSSYAQTSQRCFTETGFCIAGRIREFWEQNGGLQAFGLPTAPLQTSEVEGRPVLAQWFERNRLELHPENARPYDVLLGRLGVDRLQQQGRDWPQFPKGQPQSGCRYFAETGHNICSEILAAWRANGLEFDGTRGTSEAESLALVGLPLSEPQEEDTPNGRFTVQWFERARFELHPENQPPYNVLLGLLGNEVHPSSTESSFPLNVRDGAEVAQTISLVGAYPTHMSDG
jgi:polysaccharide biosynthesis protein PslG